MLLLCLILDVALLAYTWHCHNPNSKMQDASENEHKHKQDIKPKQRALVP
jgi:hypothetical protein